MSQLEDRIPMQLDDAPSGVRSADRDLDLGQENRRVDRRPLRFILYALGLFLCFWPFFDPIFRNLENNLTGLVCLPVASGLGLLLIASAIETAWLRSAAWFWVLLVSQATTVQLVNAGWQLRYQHYKPFDEILASPLDSILLGLLGLQTLVVLIGLRRWWRKIDQWSTSTFRPWQLAALSVFFILSTTTVSQNLAVYLQEWAFAVFLQTLSLATVILLAASIPTESVRHISRKLSGLVAKGSDPEPGSIDRFAVACAAFVTVIAAVLCILSYERHPHVPDEVAYLTHARFFAAGALTLPAPPVPAGFEVYLMEITGGQWYPAPPPGWPLILSVGVLLGIPWLINPILAGLNLLLAYVLLREIYPKALAKVSIALLAVSPWYIFLGMSFMTHMFTLTCVLLAAIGVAWSRRSSRSIWAVLGGFALGMVALIRPLEAVAMAGLLGLWAIGVGGKRLRPTAIAGLVLAAMVVGGIGLAYNAALTGNPMEFPINAYADKHFGAGSNDYGFGSDRGMGWALDPYPGHGPLDALVNTNLNVSAINTELFGWGVGSFLLVGIAVFVGRLHRSDLLMLAVIAVIYVLHFFYYFSGGPDFGARYWFLMIVPLAVLAARGIFKLASQLYDRSESAGLHVFASVIALCVVSTLVFVPWRAIDKYHNFRGMRPDVRYLAAEHGFGRSLVLIEGNEHPDYDSAAVYNPLDLFDEVPVYAWDRDPETRKELLVAYADRPVWLVKAPSITGRGFEVFDGPIAARDLLKALDD